MTEFNDQTTSNMEDKATTSANDSPPTHTFPSQPDLYPPQPNAGVHIAWGVMTKLNSPGTSSIIERFFCDTTLTAYSTDVPSSSNAVWQYVYSQQALPADVEVHWSIRVDNPTAPKVAMGAYPMAKEHLDGHLSSGNINTASDIYTPLLNAIPSLQKQAKY